MFNVQIRCVCVSICVEKDGGGSRLADECIVPPGSQTVVFRPAVQPTGCRTGVDTVWAHTHNRSKDLNCSLSAQGKGLTSVCRAHERLTIVRAV